MSHPLIDDFAARLVAVMTEKGLKNPDVADAVGVVANTVSKWRQRLQMPSAEQLPKLAAFLDMPEAWLLFGDGRASVRETAVEPYAARQVRSLPLAVREYLDETRLRLTRGEATEDEVDEAIALLRSPHIFSYFSGGTLNEFTETDVLDGMRSIVENAIIPLLRSRGRKIP